MIIPFWPKHSMVFKGGGGGGSAPPVAAGTPPPATTTTAEVVQAKRDSRRQGMKKKGIQSTILAGETGGFKKEKVAAPKTVLGGY